MDTPTTRQALASREQELRTLLELAQAFGGDLDRDAILRRLGFALRGQLLVGRVAAFLRAPGGLAPADADAARLLAAVPGGVPEALADLDRPTDLGAGPLAEAGFSLAVPLRAGTVSRGVVLLGRRASGETDPRSFDFAAALAALAVGALETADRVAERVAAERAEEEMRLARAIQRGLLPRTLPAVPGLDVAVRWRPSAAVSGDTYDVAALPPAPGGGGRLVVAVADVVGKGLPAALLTSTLQAGLRLLRPDGADGIGDSLALATARLDRLIAESTEPHQFATLAWAVVGGGHVWSVAAGHPAPRLVRADGTVRALDGGGPLLGVVPDAHFVCTQAAFAPGDALVLFSDGLTEVLRADGDEWGEAGLDAALADAGSGHAAGDLLDRLVAASDAFAGPDAPDVPDDLTVVVVRHAGADEVPAGSRGGVGRGDG